MNFDEIKVGQAVACESDSENRTVWVVAARVSKNFFALHRVGGAEAVHCAALHPLTDDEKPLGDALAVAWKLQRGGAE